MLRKKQRLFKGDRKMSKRSVLALLVVLALSVVSPVAAEEFVVKNDSIADIVRHMCLLK